MHIVMLNLPHDGTFTLEDYLVAPRASQPSSISAAEPHGPRSTHLYGKPASRAGTSYECMDLGYLFMVA